MVSVMEIFFPTTIRLTTESIQKICSKIQNFIFNSMRLDNSRSSADVFDWKNKPNKICLQWIAVSAFNSLFIS